MKRDGINCSLIYPLGLESCLEDVTREHTTSLVVRPCKLFADCLYGDSDQSGDKTENNFQNITKE